MENRKIGKWGVFEERFSADLSAFVGNPFTEIKFSAEFTHSESAVEVQGFYDGDGVFLLRFMPECEGEWNYRTRSNLPALGGKTGVFTCVSAEGGNHGVARVFETYHFAYDDKKRCYPFGTTCYAWLYQSEALQEQTLETLKASPFNKLRFCIFPKWYDYNRKEPELYPFAGSPEEGFDYLRPNPALFRKIEGRIAQLGRMGIEFDLILFHPYDKPEWGFSNMGKEADDAYLKYVVSRFGAFHNVWWAVANEYDLFFKVPEFHLEARKEPEDWDRFFHIIQRYDPYQHLRSIHNCLKLYDHGKPWVTHCSIQRVDTFRTAENTDEWRKLYQKPVVIDECAYEGNINWGWGNISGEELTRRFWEGFVRGGYVGHGETYTHPQDILWWSHGGTLHGTSPERIAFLRKIAEECPYPISPIDSMFDVTCGGAVDKYYLFYFGFYRPSFREFRMNEQVNFRVDVIDTWNMTVTPLPGTYRGNFRIELPGRPYIAVRMAAV